MFPNSRWAGAGASVVLVTAAWAQLPLADQAQQREALRRQLPARMATATQHAMQQRARLQLGEAASFRAVSSTLDDRTNHHIRMEQLHAGIPVLGGGMIVHIGEDGQPKRTVDAVVPGINVDPRPRITEKEAIEKSRESLPTLYQALVSNESAALKIWINSNLVHVPDPSKRVISRIPNADEFEPRIQSMHLVYLVKLAGKNLDPSAFLVDAHTGVVLKRWQDFQEQGLAADTWVARKGTGHSYYHGTREIDIGYRASVGTYRLIDPKRGNNIVLNMKDGVLFDGFEGDPFDSANSIFGDGKDWKYGMSTTGATGETAAVDVAFGIQVTWDLFNNVFGREGLDDQRSPIRARVHYRKDAAEPYGDARWSGGVAHFGDGATDDSASRTALITVAHELGHGFFGSAMDYEVGNGESSGLNEGTGDIVGSLANFYLRDMEAKGSFLPISRAVDEFAECEKDTWWRCRIFDPESYEITHDDEPVKGLRYYVENMGDREVHTQGACYGHMFVMLAHGGSANPASKLYSQFLPNGMAGIGVHKAARIFYHATTGYFVGGITPSFALMRTAYLFAAADLYGPNSLEYKAVRNAFAAINVGTPATDTANPEVSIAPFHLHADEMAARVIVTSEDDTGGVSTSLNLNGSPQLKVPGGFFSGWVDLWGKPAGAYTLGATVTDMAGKTGHASKAFDFPGALQLAKNGGFESGDANWTVTGGAAIEEGRQRSFAGEGYANIYDGTLRQTVSIPAAATRATLNFRLRVEPAVGLTQSMSVQVLSEGGQVLRNLRLYPSAYDTSSGFDNDYEKEVFDLMDWRGQTIQIRFVSGDPGPARFLVDQVNVTYSARISADLSIEADAGEGAVVARLRDIRHVAPNALDKVYFDFGPGSPVKDENGPWEVVRSTDGLARNTEITGGAELYDPFNNRLARLTENYTVRDVNQLIQNGGFESGSFGWTVAGGPGFAFGQDLSFVGSRALILGGRGVANQQVVSQRITIPAGAQTSSLSFRMRSVRPGSLIGGRDPGDHLRVRIRDANGVLLQELLDTDGVIVPATPQRALGWDKFVFSMNAYRGRTIMVVFDAQENNGNATTFYVDGVSLTYTQLGVAGQ